jgi:hypothetical protein
MPSRHALVSPSGLFVALPLVFATGMAQTVTPPESTLFSTVAEEAYSTYQMSSGNGDLWPSCWANDGNLYAANGDGTNFSESFYPMAVAQIAGMPPSLTGTFVAGDVGENYSGNPYTDKPTGMACVGGAIYLAYQNLNENTFEDAPAASVVESQDYGATWSANPATPMFGTPGNASDPTAYLFTTIFFLDFGQNYANAIDQYVYAYGLDNNWRDQTAVYLGRVPATSILDRSTWQFFAGMNGNTPQWTGDITQKVAVLTDQIELYPDMFGTDCPPDQKIIAQGGAVYDQPINRFIMVTWGCATHEFFESPTPWGPWSHFLSNDFGPLRLLQNRGQYGTKIPSKYISGDGLTLYLQSNVCCSGNSYTYSLRRVYLQLYNATTPTNPLSNTNLAQAPGVRAISKSTHFGSLCSLNCADQLNSGNMTASEDDYDEEEKTVDWWGYTWPQAYNINQVTYTTGSMFSNGGWYASGLTVQVRQDFQWMDVGAVTFTPAYPYSNSAGSQQTYNLSFPATWGDGVRIMGTPGGSGYFTSITQLGVYYAATLVGNPGFNLSVMPRTISVAPGNSATGTVSVAPTFGFNQQVSFACSGLPSESSCGFSPSTLTPIGQNIATTTISIHTSASSSARNTRHESSFGGGAVLALLCLIYPRRRRRESRWIDLGLFFTIAVCLCGTASGCGGGISQVQPSSSGTPAGVYTLTITASSGSGTAAVVQSATLLLTVE